MCQMGYKIMQSVNGVTKAVLPMEEVQRESTTSLLEKVYRAVTSPIRLLPDFLIIGTQRCTPLRQLGPQFRLGRMIILLALFKDTI
jgi:hypothetical protein